MNKKAVRSTIAILTTVVTTALISTSPAMASEISSSAVAGHHVATTASKPQTPALRYSDLDILNFLIFARGPIARDKPELVSQMNMTPVTDVPDSVTQEVLAELLVVDPNFHQNVTVLAQAHDPYKAQASLKNFTADMNAAAAKHHVDSNMITSASVSAANGSVWAFSNWVVSVQAVVAAAVAVSIAGVVAAFVVVAYQRPSDGTAIVGQKYAASWAGM